MYVLYDMTRDIFVIYIFLKIIFFFLEYMLNVTVSQLKYVVGLAFIKNEI